MSLIHDALRKAAEENQPAGQKNRPASWRDVAPPPPKRRRTAWLWVAAASLLPISVGVLVWNVASPPAPAPVTAAPAIEQPQPASPAPPVSSAPPAVEQETPPAPPPPARDPAPAPVTVAPVTKQPAAAPPAAAPPREPTPAPARVEPAPAPANVTPAAAPAAGLSAAPGAPRMIVPPAQQGQLADGTYVLEAEVDGKKLLLDFIVWSEAPFAQINSRQVGVGQQVEGFLVTAITRDSVLLESPTRRLVLKVR